MATRKRTASLDSALPLVLSSCSSSWQPKQATQSWYDPRKKDLYVRVPNLLFVSQGDAFVKATHLGILRVWKVSNWELSKRGCALSEHYLSHCIKNGSSLIQDIMLKLLSQSEYNRPRRTKSVSHDRPEGLGFKSYALLTLTETPRCSAVAVTHRKEMASPVLTWSFCCVGGCDQHRSSPHLSGSVPRKLDDHDCRWYQS